MEGLRLRLLRLLDQHQFRTGTQMGEALGMSRAAVHKHVQALVAQGVPIHRVPGRGYRLAEGVALLDRHAIGQRLSAPAAALVSRIETLAEVDSTSAHLGRLAATEPLHGRVCLAEAQSAGRGRRGRYWVASPYRDLMMSIGLEYEPWPGQLPALGLVAALAIAGALERLGVQGLKVKWPNDIVYEDRKLCGVLLDVTGEAHGACRVIIGIGVNVSIDEEQARRIDQQWIDLDAITASTVDRNTLAARLLDALLPAFKGFPAQGFAGHRAAWRRRDALRGRSVVVRGADGGTRTGTAEGVDDTGRLRLAADGEIELLTQGEVSVRPR